MSVQREMTLDEWCSKLPESHLVNKELRQLKSRATESKACDGCKRILDGGTTCMACARYPDQRTDWYERMKGAGNG